VQQQYQQVAAALPRHARVVVHDENNHLGLEAQSIMDRFPFEYGISYGLQPTPRDVYALYRSLGATHVLWAAKSKGTDSLAGDIMFFDFVMRRAADAGAFGAMHLSSMPDEAPSAPFNDTVAVFSCAASYPTGCIACRIYECRVWSAELRLPSCRAAPDAARLERRPRGYRQHCGDRDTLLPRRRPS